MWVKIRRWLWGFFDSRLDFRVRMFNVLASVGIFIGAIATITCVVNEEALFTTLVNFSAVPASLGLMLLARKTGRYRCCYMLTIVCIFLLLFPVIFALGGGYASAMPSFFIFALVFTAFMLEEKAALGFMGVELAVYIALCVLAYRFPGWITLLSSERAVLTDIVVGFSVCGIALGVSTMLLFRMYRRQQAQLEQAREEALELSRAKTSFLANMSHEIRTPISVMLGMNEMVLRESGDEAVREYSASIQSAGKTLLNLIRNVLDVSKIESGKLMLEEEHYRVEELVRELVLLGQSQARAKGLEFKVNVAEDMPTWLRGDYLRVKQIGVNFISNAVKYTHKGSIVLSLSHEPGEKQGQVMLNITVQDTGVGVKSGDIAGLFDTFSRADLPAHRSIEGSGLGLAIARELAELMNGHITVQSEYGRGSTFGVRLPQGLGRPQPAEEGQRREARPPACLLCPAGRVLVVDDSPENLQVISALLQRTLLQVDLAQSGAECLELLRENRYHVVLLDHMMPVMDGLETLERIRRLDNGAQVPVVVLTANAAAGAKEMLLEKGFTAYLAKPVSWQKLEGLLACLLPARLLSFGISARLPAVPQESRQQLTLCLEEYGISLEAGLRYLSGDLHQYGKMAHLFREGVEEGRQRARQALENRDYAALKHLAHTLKSRAMAIGAADLHRWAHYVEKHCGETGGAFVLAAGPVLLLEWARAGEGLGRFAALMAQLCPNAQPQPEEKETASRRALARQLAACRRGEALAELEALNAGQPEKKALWAAIKAAVEQLDFESAHQLATEEGEWANGG